MGLVGFHNFLGFGLALALGGCTNLLSEQNIVDMAGTAPVAVIPGNKLEMPTDLQLPPPGYDAFAVRQRAATLAEIYQQPQADSIYDATAASGLPPSKVEILAMYGISTIANDGTRKSDVELSLELRQAVLKRRRLNNPS